MNQWPQTVQSVEPSVCQTIFHWLRCTGAVTSFIPPPPHTSTLWPTQTLFKDYYVPDQYTDIILQASDTSTQSSIRRDPIYSVRWTTYDGGKGGGEWRGVVVKMKMRRKMTKTQQKCTIRMYNKRGKTGMQQRLKVDYVKKWNVRKSAKTVTVL